MSKLECPDGNFIAYNRHEVNTKLLRHNNPTPGVIFLHGFKSDQNGSKALFLDGLCKTHDIPFVRFDFYGHGASSGDFRQGTIGRWIEDTLLVLDTLTTGPQILIGSSLGGWIMLHAALRRKSRVAGLIGVAAAPDFTERLIWDALTPEQKMHLQHQGSLDLSSPYSPPDYIVTQNLIIEARNHLLLDTTIDIDCPVRLLHGMKDTDVPYTFSTHLSQTLTSPDVDIILAKNSDHRMSSAEDLTLLEATLMKWIT